MSEDTIAYRDATAADAALLARLHTLSWRATYRGLLPDRYLDEELDDERAGFWGRRMSEQGGTPRFVLIAESEGAPVGFVCALREGAPGTGVLVDNLHVLPSFQRRGVAKRLLHEAAAWGRALGERTMALHVIEGNRPAVAFYEHTGWRRVGASEEHVGGARVTALHYARDIEPVGAG
jgi:GNAT superfamily N-acetyltransferase